MYKNATLKHYTDDLAARLPAPGGGSAAALAAALGAGLVSMCANFSIDKPAYARYNKRLKGILRLSERARLRFLELVDLDVEAYRSKDMKQCLGVPLDICRISLATARLCPELLAKGNTHLASDVVAAVALLEAACASAGAMVEINLGYMKDKRVSARARRTMKASLSDIKNVRRTVEVKGGGIIRRKGTC